MRFRDHAIYDAIIEPIWKDSCQQCPGVPIPQASKGELRQSANFICKTSSREEESNGILRCMPGGESDHLSRRGIKPLCIIDNAQNWALRAQCGHHI